MTDFEDTFVMGSELEFHDMWRHGYFGASNESTLAFVNVTPLVNKLLGALEEPIKFEAHGRGYEILRSLDGTAPMLSTEERLVLDLIRGEPDYHSFELSQGFLEFGRVGRTSINGCPDRVANVTGQRGALERWDGLKVMSAYKASGDWPLSCDRIPWRGSGRGFHPLRMESVSGLAHGIPTASGPLSVHLNGVMDDFPDIVFSAQQYARRAAGPDPWYAHLVAELTSHCEPPRVMGRLWSYPGFVESVHLAQRCGGLVVVVDCLVFDRGAHPEAAVTSLPVVEDLEVLEDGVGELDPGAPALPVQQLDLHTCPERFDHRVVVAVTDRSHGWEKPGSAGAVSERPRGVFLGCLGRNGSPFRPGDGC